MQKENIENTLGLIPAAQNPDPETVPDPCAHVKEGSPSPGHALADWLILGQED